MDDTTAATEAVAALTGTAAPPTTVGATLTCRALAFTPDRRAGRVARRGPFRAPAKAAPAIRKARRGDGRGVHWTLGTTLGRVRRATGLRVHEATTRTGMASRANALQALRNAQARRTADGPPIQVLIVPLTPNRICRAEGGPGPTGDGDGAICPALPVLPTQELP